MKTITLSIKSLIILIAFSSSNLMISQSVASYTISFTSVWDSEANNPLNGNSTSAMPENAHWSDLVGTTHTNEVEILQMGSLASLGVKNVAELGSNTALMNEVQDLIQNGDANQFLQASFQDFAPRTSATLMDIEVSENYPMLSLLSMIAPSPDWMIAVNSINLRDENGWRDEIIIDLFPYDAGTDSGTDYSSSNQVTNPAQPISSLVNVSPFNDKPIGTLTITFNETLSVNTSTFTEVSVFPNPSNGIININTSSANVLEKATIYNVLGKRVATIMNDTSENHIAWNVHTLNPGVYIVKLTLSDESSTTKKVIIN